MVKADFFLGYQKVDIQRHELLFSFSVPLRATWRDFKQARRRDNDFAIVTRWHAGCAGQSPKGGAL